MIVAQVWALVRRGVTCVCPLPAALTIPFGQRTPKMASPYVYTSFISNLVLAKLEAVGKLLLFDRLLYWPHIAWACCYHYETESTLRTNRVQQFRPVT